MATTTTNSRTPNGDVNLLNHTAVVADALAKAAILGAISGGLDHLSALSHENDDGGVLPMVGFLLVTVMMMKMKWMRMNHWK